MEFICIETPHPQRKEITQFMLVKVIKLSPEEELICFFFFNHTLVYIQDLAFDSSRAMIFFFGRFWLPKSTVQDRFNILQKEGNNMLWGYGHGNTS